MLLNLCRVKSRGIRKGVSTLFIGLGIKYEFMHKKTKLELGPELRQALGRC
jgi:hypothetical protein